MYLNYVPFAYSTLVKAQDMYTPGYPPMSPITVSYYGCWTIYDLPIGKDDETLGGCFAALSDLGDSAPS